MTGGPHTTVTETSTPGVARRPRNEQLRLGHVIAAIRCRRCSGEGRASLCPRCSGSGIDPAVIDEAEGWDSWAISVHDHPGRIVVVPLD